MLNIFKYPFFSLCFLIITSTSLAVERKDLIQIVEKISSSQRLLSTEVSQWNKEKETLLIELSLIKSSIKDQAENQGKLKEEVEKLKKTKAQLLETLSKQEKLKKTISDFIRKNSQTLVKICTKVPSSLQYLISDELKRLESQLKSSTTSNTEKLGTINSLTSAVLKLQKEVHKTKEVISINGQELEVDAIYLGTFTGYFKSSSKQEIGVLTLKNDKWNANSRPEQKDVILSLFKQFEKKAAPQVIKLPIGGSK